MAAAAAELVLDVTTALELPRVLFLFLLLWICFCCIKEAKFFNILCAP